MHSRTSLRTVSADLDRCLRCGKGEKVTDTVTGEIVCGLCGFVISEKIQDFGPEYRNFFDSEDRRRTGAGTSLRRHDMGLATIINPANRDVMGKTLSPSMKYTIYRLRSLDSRTQTHTSSARNLRQALNEMDKIKDKLALTDAIIEKSAYIYRKAMEKKLIRGRSIHALSAACIYAACRNTDTPRTLKDIEEVANVKRRALAKCYRVLVEKLDLKMPVVNSTHYVARIASKLEVNEKTKRLAFTILHDYELTGEMAGKNPTGLAATALYLACVKMGENITQKQVSVAANITEVTIRNRSVAIKKTLDVT